MRNTMLVTVCCVWIWQCACYDPHAQQSQIVREMEDAGSSNLDSVTLPGLVDFLSRHLVLAAKIDAQCTPLRASADAHWAVETAEGRTCQAAQMMHSRDWTGDQRAW